MVWHHGLMARAPVCIDPIPAVAFEHMAAEWTDTRPLDGRILLTADALRLLSSTIRHLIRSIRQTRALIRSDQMQRRGCANNCYGGRILSG